MNDMISSVGQTVCRHGMFVYPKDFYIGKSLEVYGEYSEIEVDFLCSLLHEGDVVVEAGANIGAITVPMAKRVGPSGTIFAFEPQTDICKILEMNLVANTTNTPFENKALGRRSGTARYNSNINNTGGVELGEDGDHIATIVRWDELDIGRLDLIKADVEGMEVDVLLGARHAIAKHRPLIYVENDQPDKSQRLIDTLFAFGYRVWRHEPPLFNPDNFNHVKEDLWPNTLSFNLIAVPEEKHVPLPVSELQEIECGGNYRINIVKTRWACVVRMGGWGDNLMTSSLFPGLKNRYDRLEVISKDPCHDIFFNNPYVDKLTVWPKEDPVTDVLEWTRAMARRLSEYDFGVHLSHSCEAKLCFFETQTEFHWPEKMRRRMANQSYLGFIHDVCDLPHDFAPNFFPSGAEAGEAVDTVRKIRAIRKGPVIGWCLSGSRIDKAYPGSAAAVARLIESGMNVVMVGAPGKEFLMAKEIERQLVQQTGPDSRGSSASLYLAMSDNIEKPNWPVRRAFSLLQQCDAVVTPDTGPGWAVAMRKMPKVVLLSHASPLNITTGWLNTTTLHADPQRVPCWPCHRLQDRWETCNKAKDIDAAACMANIPVDDIVNAVRNGVRTLEHTNV